VRPVRLFVLVLSKQERKILAGLAGLFILSALGAVSAWYVRNTHAVAAVGGTYREGVVGQPRLINPLFVAANDVDRDLSKLIFSGLMRYGSDGSLIPDLAERYETSPDGKTYTFFLKTDAFWHDGKPVTTDDIVFTISLIQNPLTQSPLKINWQGVKAEKLDERRVQFTLVSAYAPFLENTAVGILPKHLWEQVSLENLQLAELNLRPVGSGPFMFEHFRKNDVGGIYSYTLGRFAKAKPRPAYIQKVIFRFFASPDDLLKASRDGAVDGIGLLTGQSPDDAEKNNTLHPLLLPRYFAVFFNQTQSKVLADKAVRQALNDTTDTTEIINTLLGGNGAGIKGPIPPGLTEHLSGNPIGTTSPAALPPIADVIAQLERSGWKDVNGDGIREKVLLKDTAPTPLAFTLTTSDSEDLRAIAELLQKFWSHLGVKTELKFLPISELEHSVLRPRQYDALLFGEILSLEPDPFAFWHSSQKRDPGLNLALYENRAADVLLEEIRQTLDREKRLAKLQEFSKLVQEDIPAIFLYTPHFLYLLPENLRGFEMKIIALPSERFADARDWYLKTKRAWK
jgi:peptide/nickel transport system substrate-binding protein